MKKHRLLYLAALLLVTLAGLYGLKKTGILHFGTYSDKHTQHIWNEQVIGIYDRTKQTDTTGFRQFQHITIRLGVSNESDYQQVLKNLDPEKPVLITLETHGYQDENVLEKTLNGDYDRQLRTLCSSIKLKKNTFFLRWNPEMEVPVHLFPWQYQSSETYIKAFRHFATLCKTAAPAVRIVWGTAGYPGLDEYWPGEASVDLIAININSSSEQLTSIYPHEKDVKSAIRKKILRMRFMNRPVLIMSTAGNKANDFMSSQLALAVREIQKEAATIYSFLNASDPEPAKKNRFPDKRLMGVYDPTLALAASPFIQVEHLFTDLEQLKNGTFKKQFNEVISRKHDVIVTFEPWRDKNLDESDVLTNTVNGLYDKQLTDFYHIISNVKQTVYIRFAHEMEIPIHRYPWQSQDPVKYIKAFRYFMNFSKNKYSHIKKIWGPAGDRGSIDFWPGGDVVDYVSIAIYGLPDKNITDPYKQEMFSSIYNRKSHRMRFAHKPIFITESGVMGPDDFQEKWLDDAAATIKAHKEVVGICYFNLADNPKVWGDIPAPEWSISKKTFDHFIQELSNQ